MFILWTPNGLPMLFNAGSGVEWTTDEISGLSSTSGGFSINSLQIPPIPFTVGGIPGGFTVTSEMSPVSGGVQINSLPSPPPQFTLGSILGGLTIS